MNKVLTLLLLASFLAVSGLSNVLAYSPYDGYYGDYPSSKHYVSESISAGHYSYVVKDSYDGAYGKVESYKRIDDYTPYYRPAYSGYAYRNYGNALSGYWHDGPNLGYSRVYHYNTGYDGGEPYVKTYSRVVNSPYSSYHYRPYYNGHYYGHSYADYAYRGCSYYC